MEISRLKTNLYPFQVSGVEFCLKTPYSILGFQMGLGKTVISLAVACKYNLKTLVICPAYLKPNWEREIETHTNNLDIEVISYTSMAKLKTITHDLVIADEAHYLKNKQAKRTENFHNLIKTKRPKRLILMSGSAIKNRVSEFFSLLQLCHYGGQYEEFKPFDQLYYKFCNYFSYERSFEINGFTVTRFDGVKRPDELRALIKPVYIRKRADQINELPDFQEIWVKGKFKNQYEKNLKEAFELFNQDHKDPAYMSLKRANAMAKVNDTIALAKDIMDQGEKVIIFSDHVAPAEEIAKALKIPVATGKVDGETRGKMVLDFESGKYQGLSATIGSLSTGVTLVSASHMIFNDYPFVPGDLEQAQARIRRIGQVKKCFYHFIYNSDFDKKLLDMLRRKQSDIRKIYD